MIAIPASKKHPYLLSSLCFFTKSLIMSNVTAAGPNPRKKTAPLTPHTWPFGWNTSRFFQKYHTETRLWAVKNNSCQTLTGCAKFREKSISNHSFTHYVVVFGCFIGVKLYIYTTKTLTQKNACSYGQCHQLNKIKLIIYKVVELQLWHLSVKHYNIF